MVEVTDKDPDGRVQHVNYHTNDLEGYIAEVIYDGTAAFPDVIGHGISHGVAHPVAHGVATPALHPVGHGVVGGHGLHG